MQILDNLKKFFIFSGGRPFGSFGYMSGHTTE